MLGDFIESEGPEAQDDELPTIGDAISRLPATATLPSFTMASSNGIPPSVTAPIKRPREKLETVLKETDRLLRNTKASKKNVSTGTKTDGSRQLEDFLLSWKTQKLSEHRKQSSTGGSSGSSLKKALFKALPSNLMTAKPKLSADNSLKDDLEIILSNTDKSIVGNTSKSLRMVKQNIAPKVKTASIDKLNADLKQKIKEQQAKTEEQRRREREISERLQREAMRKRQIEEEDDAIVGASDSSEVDVVGAYEEAALQQDDEDEDFVLPELRKRHVIESDEEVSKQPDFGSVSMRRRVILQDEEDQSQTEDKIAQLAVFEAEDGLTQMLSGKFAGSDDESHNGDANDSDNETDSLGGDKHADQQSVQEDAPIEETDSSKLETKQSFNRMAFFDEEAEDEDSDVSADDLDEEKIARELQESAFLVNDEEGEEFDEDEQRAIHRKLQHEQDEMETEVFMNRFIPDSILREMGTYGELRKKYSRDDVHDLYDSAEYESKLARVNTDVKVASAFGKAPTYKVMAGTSNPEFLELLAQDKLSSEYCPTDHSEANLSDDEHQEEHIEVESLGIQEVEDELSIFSDSSSAIRIEQHSISMRSIKLDLDNNLKGRLVTLTKETSIDQQARNADPKKKTGTTFEMVSSRPVLQKDKVLSKTKQK